MTKKCGLLFTVKNPKDIHSSRNLSSDIISYGSRSTMCYINLYLNNENSYFILTDLLKRNRSSKINYSLFNKLDKKSKLKYCLNLLNMRS